MEAFQQITLPRRVTRIYSDTKKSITHVVESHARERDPRFSGLYVSLGIQKDRLFAWGLEWADSNTTEGKDIDASLDRAGISDLVESIMGTINKLLAEAEHLRNPDTHPTPGAFPLSPSEDLEPMEMDITRRCAARLDQITSTITTSIDTLCDLSRVRQTPSSRTPQPTPFMPASSETLTSDSSSGLSSTTLPPSKAFSRNDITAPSNATMPLESDEINISRLRMAEQIKVADAPPSYESVAAGTGTRIMAQMGLQEVIVEFSPNPRIVWTISQFPSYRRYQELVTALRPPVGSSRNPYTGTLRLLGWFADRSTSRYGFIYELPRMAYTSSSSLISTARMSTSHTLLSFLQYGADLESSNMPALEDRFRLALNLASSVALLHRKGILHRNLNSTGVLFFMKDVCQSENRKIWKEGIIRRPYVVAFDDCAEDSPTTDRSSVLTDIYRHPYIESGQRTLAQASHDIYSLGLILLEIGLWMPLHRLWKARYTRLDFKDRIESIYVNRLMAKCGSTYMRVVEYCLKAADANYTSYPSMQPHQQHSSQASASLEPNHQRFLEKIIWPLGRCCIMDDNEEPSFAPLEDSRLASHVSYPVVPEEVDVAKEPDKSGEVDISERSANVQQSASDMSVVSGDRLLVIKASQSVDKSAGTPDSNPSKHSGDSDQPTDVVPHNLIQTAEEEPFSGKNAATQGTHHAGMSLANSGPRNRERRRCLVQRSEVPVEHRKYWETTMLPPLRKILQRVIDRWEAYSIDVLMIGESIETAKPTIYMMCDSTHKARKALQYVNRDRRLFDIKVVKGQIERSKARKKRKLPKAKAITTTNSENSANPLHQTYQPKPGCGASIGAYIRGQHLPPVSFGGTILVNDQPFAMSVHHMLEYDELEMGLEDPPELGRSMAFREDFTPDWSRGSLFDEDVYALSEDDDDGYQSSFSDLSEAGDWFGGGEESFEEEYDIGNTPGFSPGTADDIFITQPAIDDVAEGFFPNPHDVNEEHLLSHKLGYLHASSGIKRIFYAGIPHEIDWALIKVDDGRSEPQNVVRGGASFSKSGASMEKKDGRNATVEPASYPQSPKKAEELGGIKVHALGRTSGLQGGMILPAMSLVKMPGRVTDSLSWTVIGGFGNGGDSGAWVIDNATNHTCAHVLAWSERNGAAYISPMDIMLDDIAQTLGAKVSFPISPAVTPVTQDQNPEDPGYFRPVPTLAHGEADESAVRSSPDDILTAPPRVSMGGLVSSLPAPSVEPAASSPTPQVTRNKMGLTGRRRTANSLPSSSAVEALTAASTSKRFSSPPPSRVNRRSYGSSQALMC